jgi:hypothetical protein
VLELIIRVTEKASSRVRSLLLDAGFPEVRQTLIREVRGDATAVITARTCSPVEEVEQQLLIGAIDESLIAEGITFELSADGVAAGEIRSEWVTIILLDSGDTTDVKINVANRFEVEQELGRVADLLGVGRDQLTVVPRPFWLPD